MLQDLAATKRHAPKPRYGENELFHTKLPKNSKMSKIQARKYC